MFPEDTLNLGAYVEITAEVEGERTLVHSGDVSCRKLENGGVWYHIKQKRGKAFWFSHGEVVGTHAVNFAEVEEREQVQETGQWAKNT